MLVVDRSGLRSAAALGNAVGALVDALADTESSVAVVDFSAGANVRVGYTLLDDSSRSTFDGYATSLSTGGAANWDAGLATANTGSPDLTVLITGGGPNASDDPTAHGGHEPAATADQPLFFAIEHANQIKAGGSRLFALGVGGAGAAALAAVSGPNAGSDIGSSDYSMGGVDAVAASLHALAGDGCAPVAAALDDVSILAGPNDFPNSGGITITSPTTAGASQPASPYPSTISVSGMTGLISDVDVHLFGVNHDIAHDIDILLVGPTGASIVLMSDVPSGGGFPAINANLTFDDQAAARFPNGDLTGGTFKPSDNDVNQTTIDSWPSAAPATRCGDDVAAPSTAPTRMGPGACSSSTTPQLTMARSAGGWSLTITTQEAAVATTTAVVSSQNPSLTSANVTFTATVTSSGSPVTAGHRHVQRWARPTLGVPVTLNPSGQATFSTATLTEGSHVITATYNGTTGFLPALASLTQVVDTPTTTPAQGQWCNTGAITVPTAGAVDAVPVAHHRQRHRHVHLPGHRPTRQPHAHRPHRPRHPPRRPGRPEHHADERRRRHHPDRADGDAHLRRQRRHGDPGGSISSGHVQTDQRQPAATRSPRLPRPSRRKPRWQEPSTATNPNGMWSLYVFDDATGDDAARSAADGASTSPPPQRRPPR